MKYRLSSIAAVSFGAVLSAAVMTVQPAQAQTCATVEVQNIRPEQGMLMVAAYADATGFGSKAPVAALQMRPGTATTMSFPLCGLSGGSVALTLFQDINGNGKLDANVFGMPTEPWGASGKPAAMSAPTWDTTAVPLDGTTIVVKLSK